MNNELQHHGIMGQKWGIRRYQNADGSLTKEGQKRYNTIRGASAYARDMGDFWKRSYDDEKANLEAYEKKYSGKDGLKRYKKEVFDYDMSDGDLDSLYLDKEAERDMKNDIKYMTENMNSMKVLAQEMYNIAAEYSSYSLDQIPDKKLKEGEKYAKKWEKQLKNTPASEIPEWWKEEVNKKPGPISENTDYQTPEKKPWDKDV